MKQAIRASVVVFCCGAASLWAQTAPSANQTVPVYKITVVGRTINAINYRPRSGSTRIDFRGTSLMAKASGKAEVSSKRGVTTVHAEFHDLGSPSQFGPEYLTYVLWAITPDGHPTNVAEIIPHDGKATLDVTVNLQAFGLIVTAEPYFAVRMPSDVVVLQNEVTKDTTGKIEQINAKYELLGRGQYTRNVAPSQVPSRIGKKEPLDLLEAENAVAIAGYADAQKYGGDTYTKAEQLLSQAETEEAHKRNSREITMTAREAVQTAEDARTIAVRVAEQQAQAEEQKSQAEKLEAERAQEQQEAAARAQAEAAQKQAEAQAQQQAEEARLQAQQQEQEQEEEQRKLQEAKAQAQQAEAQRQQMRARLVQQLNSILQTRQSSRGLVVTMSHVFFDTGKSNLHEGNEQVLAKIAGVLLAYPGVKVEVDGYTDNTGSPDLNQELSQKRADTVQQFLVQQGLPADEVTARGFGESDPVAPNDTPMDRALNRRVEIVISGDAIGYPISSSPN